MNDYSFVGAPQLKRGPLGRSRSPFPQHCGIMKASDTRLFVLYLHELFMLAKAVRDGCDHVFAQTPPPANGHYIKVDPDLHSTINGVLIDAANIKKLVHTGERRLTKESKKVFELRQERSRLLRLLLNGVELDEIVNTRVRNTLEHFDEYLDETNIALSSGRKPPAPMAAYNMTFSDWDVTTPRVFPLRLYVGSERKYYNMKYSIDLSRLRAQAAAVVDRLLSSEVMRGVPEPGGLMVPLPGYK